MSCHAMCCDVRVRMLLHVNRFHVCHSRKLVRVGVRKYLQCNNAYVDFSQHFIQVAGIRQQNHNACDHNWRYLYHRTEQITLFTLCLAKQAQPAHLCTCVCCDASRNLRALIDGTVLCCALRCSPRHWTHIFVPIAV